MLSLISWLPTDVYSLGITESNLSIPGRDPLDFANTWEMDRPEKLTAPPGDGLTVRKLTCHAYGTKATKGSTVGPFELRDPACCWERAFS